MNTGLYASLASASFPAVQRDTSVSRTEAQATIPSPTSSLAIVSLAAHNDYVITNSLDSKLCRYGLPDGAHQASTSLKPSQAWQIALHPEGNVLATAGDIAKVSLLKASQEGFGEVLSTMDGRGVFATCCAYSPNGTLLATATSSGEVSLYDAAQGVLIQTFPGQSNRFPICMLCIDVKLAHAKTIRSLTFSADSALLITGVCPCLAIYLGRLNSTLITGRRRAYQSL